MLALAALAISRIFRRPALSHALWLIVLLKLITPPLWNVALPLIPPEKTHKAPLPPTELSMPPAEVLPPIEMVDANESESERWAVPTLQPSTITDAAYEHADAGGSGTLARHAQHGHASTPVHATRIAMSQCFLISWIAGSILCIFIVTVRLRRFTRLLNFAHPADAHTQMQARALSSRVGMKSSPRVWFVPGPLCPMLWAFGSKAKLLIPAGLWERLEESQRSTLLLHELAHYRRGDHWIRALELLITILFWWNPIAWWARHELREAEEQCCDAWVIWTLPKAARDYAIALMEAIDFVSTTRLAVPVLASPMGEFHDLKRRLLMIKQHAPRALGWRGFSLLCVLAATLLPLSATLAQQATAPPPGPAGLPPTGPEPELPVVPVQTTAAPIAGDFTIGIAPATNDNDPNAAAQGEAQALMEELKKTSDEIAKLTVRLRAAQERLAQIQRTTNVANPFQIAPAPPTAEAVPGAIPVPRGRPRTNGYGPGMGGYPAPGERNATVQNNNVDQERRLRAVEQKLDRLIEELHAAREQRKDQPDQPDQPAPRRGGYGGLQAR